MKIITIIILLMFLLAGCTYENKKIEGTGRINNITIRGNRNPNKDLE